MKSIYTTILSVLFLAPIFAQTYSLTVNNGYGSGMYQAGDTVHIWSQAYDNTKTFSSWSGDVQFLARPKEWHTTILMPNQDVSVYANVVDMPSYSISFEQIMGVAILKNVYSYFPTNPKGVIYFFHGTNGSAANIINSEETRSFINAAISNSYGIIVTESEETSLNVDLNNDGMLRWKSFPMDTINGTDYLNIRILRDTFQLRGNILPSTPIFTVGVSNGGAFSAAVSQAYNFKAGVSYIASSVMPLFEVRENPFAFRMALYDDHEEVGSEGNYQAWQHDSILDARGICHDYEIYDKQPLYPQRFARIAGISTLVSQDIFNELLENGDLNSSHYALHSDIIKSNVLATPSAYSVLSSLTPSVQLSILNQISTSNAEHKFYSDLTNETLEFLDLLCTSTASNEILNAENKKLHVFPNPVTIHLHLDLESKQDYVFKIFDLKGNLLASPKLNSSDEAIDVSFLNSGIYFISVQGKQKVEYLKFVID